MLHLAWSFPILKISNLKLFKIICAKLRLGIVSHSTTSILQTRFNQFLAILSLFTWMMFGWTAFLGSTTHVLPGILSRFLIIPLIFYCQEASPTMGMFLRTAEQTPERTIPLFKSIVNHYLFFSKLNPFLDVLESTSFIKINLSNTLVLYRVNNSKSKGSWHSWFRQSSCIRKKKRYRLYVQFYDEKFT